MQTPENDPLLAAFQQGKVLAYPTEAVFGLGCDPDNQQAVEAILALKQRPASKGLILIADNYSQLLPYVNDNRIGMDRRSEIFSSWPGPVTWLLPKSSRVANWLSGDSANIAVRVSAHPVVKSLCVKFGKPLVSTSANVSGQPAATSAEQIKMHFAEQVVLVEGEVGGASQPSMIRDGATGRILRG